jgi:glycosyltransferase involved in cell wall biosynthesis
VVASDVGGLPEVIRSGSNGILVPVSDDEAAASQIRKLSKDGEWCRALGSAARATVIERFTVARTAQRLLDFHTEWAHRHAQPPRQFDLAAALS